MMMGRNLAGHGRLALIAALLLPAACAGDPEFGTAVQRNIAFQAVDLEPRYAGVPMEGGNGERSARAIKHYEGRQGNAVPEATAGATPKG